MKIIVNILLSSQMVYFLKATLLIMFNRKVFTISLVSFIASAMASLSSAPTHAYFTPRASYTPVRITLTAAALGSQEPVGIPALPGSAALTATIDLVAQSFCYQVSTKSVPGMVRGVIAAGTVGHIGKSLIPISSAEFGAHHLSCVFTPASLLQKIVNSPASYYFEIQGRSPHSGGIRGQLHN